MPKRSRHELYKLILTSLVQGEVKAYGLLEREVNTSWRTIRDLVADLELFECIEHQEGGVKITATGKKTLKKIN